MSRCGSMILPVSSARSTQFALSSSRPTGGRPTLSTLVRLRLSLRAVAHASPIFSRKLGQGAMRIVRLEGEIDFEGFRRVARGAAASGVRPDAIRFVMWNADEENDLFSEQEALVLSTTS